MRAARTFASALPEGGAIGLVAAAGRLQDRIQRLAHSREATVNEVVLTLCGGALRRYLGERGALPGAVVDAEVGAVGTEPVHERVGQRCEADLLKQPGIWRAAGEPIGFELDAARAMAARTRHRQVQRLTQRLRTCHRRLQIDQRGHVLPLLAIG